MNTQKNHSLDNIIGHVTGYFEREVTNIETKTNRLLRGKTGANTFVNGRSARFTVRAQSTGRKGGAVTDSLLVFNIPDPALAQPIFHTADSAADIIATLSIDRCRSQIEQNIQKMADERIDSGENELDSTEKLFRRILEAKKFDANKVSKALSLTKTTETISGIDILREDGFQFACRTLLSALDAANISYQRVENQKNRRLLIIDEYFLPTGDRPDESFSIRLEHFNKKLLEQEQKRFDRRKKILPDDFDPYSVVPGLVLSFKITTIKKRQATFEALSPIATDVLSLLSVPESANYSLPPANTGSTYTPALKSAVTEPAPIQIDASISDASPPKSAFLAMLDAGISEAATAKGKKKQPQTKPKRAAAAAAAAAKPPAKAGRPRKKGLRQL